MFLQKFCRTNMGEGVHVHFQAWCKCMGLGFRAMLCISRLGINAWSLGFRTHADEFRRFTCPKIPCLFLHDPGVVSAKPASRF